MEKMSAEEVIDQIIRLHTLNKNDFFDSNNRKGYISRVRFYTYYILRNHLSLGCVQISRLFGRKDHSAVLKALRKIDSDPRLIRESEKVWYKINEEAFSREKLTYFNFIYYVAKKLNIPYPEAFVRKRPLEVCAYAFASLFKLDYTQISYLMRQKAVSLRQRNYNPTPETRSFANECYKEFLEKMKHEEPARTFCLVVPNYKTSKVEYIERNFIWEEK